MGPSMPEACSHSHPGRADDWLQHPDWFAVQVRAKHEKVVSARLSDQGLENLLPLYHVRHTWSDRTKELELPLFEGYVLCKFHYPNRVTILRIPGVRSILCFGSVPGRISEKEIADIRTVLASGLDLQPWTHLTVGQRVSVQRGPLRGVEGIVIKIRQQWRIVVGIDILQRSVAVEVARDEVERVQALQHRPEDRVRCTWKAC